MLVAQLERAGFDADFRMTSDAYTRMAQGTAHAFMTGHGGSVRDPYFTLRLYHSRFVQPTGTHAERFWRWSNPEYDAIVDKMGQTSPDDPELQNLFRQAMEIWLKEHLQKFSHLIVLTLLELFLRFWNPMVHHLWQQCVQVLWR